MVATPRVRRLPLKAATIAAALPWAACALLGGRALGWTGVFAFALAWPAAAPGPLWLPALCLLLASLGLWSVAGLWVAVSGVLFGGVYLATRSMVPHRLWHYGSLFMAAALWSIAVQVHLHHLSLLVLLLVPLQAGLAAGLGWLFSLPGAITAPPAAASMVVPRWVLWAVATGVVASGLAGWTVGPISLRLLLLVMFTLWTAESGSEIAVASAVLSVLVGGIDGQIAGASTASIAMAVGVGAFSVGTAVRWPAPYRLVLGVAVIGATAVLAGAAVLPLVMTAILASVLYWGLRLPTIAAYVPRSGALITDPLRLPDRLQWTTHIRAQAHAVIELSRQLAQTAAAGAPEPSPEREGLMLAEQVCPGCAAFSSCWERRLPRAQAMVTRLWQSAIEGNVGWQQVGGPDTIYCLRPREMAEVANRRAALARQRVELRQLLLSSRRSSVEPLLSIGRDLAHLADAVSGMTRGTREERLGSSDSLLLEVDHQQDRIVARDWEQSPSGGLWGFSATAANRAADSGAPCGDTCRLWLAERDVLALAVSDGMGSGAEAAHASEAAIAVLRGYLADGSTPLEALEAVNVRLLETGASDSFATLDLFLINLQSGVAHTLKAGAPSTYLLRGTSVRETMGGGLPIGVLEDVQVRSATLRLHDGDTLIMVSDGVMGGPAGGLGQRRSKWVPAWLRDSGGASPGQIALGMVQQAQSRYTSGPQDDITVVACRLVGYAAEDSDLTRRPGDVSMPHGGGRR